MKIEIQQQANGIATKAEQSRPVAWNPNGSAGFNKAVLVMQKLEQQCRSMPVKAFCRALEPHRWGLTKKEWGEMTQEESEQLQRKFQQFSAQILDHYGLSRETTQEMALLEKKQPIRAVLTFSSALVMIGAGVSASIGIFDAISALLSNQPISNPVFYTIWLSLGVMLGGAKLYEWCMGWGSVRKGTELLRRVARANGLEFETLLKGTKVRDQLEQTQHMLKLVLEGQGDLETKEKEVLLGIEKKLREQHANTLKLLSVQEQEQWMKEALYACVMHYKKSKNQ